MRLPGCTTRNKYGAIKTEVDGILWASKKEAGRYRELCLRLKAGEISDLRWQIKYPLKVNGNLICTYIADWQYVENGVEVVEDSKGVKTPQYRIKAKLMKALYGIEIKET